MPRARRSGLFSASASRWCTSQASARSIRSPRADKGGERAIRAIIERDRPNDAILGEEYGEKPGQSGLRWVLDPVDGTRAFITGRHEWGSLIALEDKEVPVLGILDQPVLGERFLAVNGRAVLLEGEKRTLLKVRGMRGTQTRDPLCHRSFGLFRAGPAGGLRARAGWRRA